MPTVMRIVRGRLPMLLATALGASCGAAGPPGSGAATGTETVQLGVEHRSEWRQLWIEGSTDLPDGAYVNYRVSHELTGTAPADEWPAANLMESGRAGVKNGQYWTRINTFNWPRGRVHIVVRFPLPPQPPDVEARYGPFGERLTGDNVTTQAGSKVVEVEYVFDHRR